MIQSKTRDNPKANKELFDACDRSCVLNLQEPEDGEKAELTEHCNFKFLIPHDWLISSQEAQEHRSTHVPPSRVLPSTQSVTENL